MSNLSDIITSVRAQIPDPTSSVSVDGTAFTLSTLLIWINEAARVLATRAPVVQDWYALQSQNAQMTYALPANIISVEQCWFDLWPLTRAAELDDLQTTKITSRSYFFGPHSIGAQPYLHVYPATNRTGASTTLDSGGISAAATTFSATTGGGASFKSYGFLTIDGELMKYDTLTTDTFSNVFRGMAGTVAAAHTTGATIFENNLFFKVARLPVAVVKSDDTLEIPQGLLPLIELFVLAKVRAAEQEHDVSLKMMEVYNREVDRLATAYAPRGQRHGLQVRREPPGPVLYFGRVVVP